MITVSSSGAGDRLHDLRKQEDFDYGLIRHTDVLFMAAAISAPDVCAREHERAWAVNVTGTSTFISHALSEGARHATRLRGTYG